MKKTTLLAVLFMSSCLLFSQNDTIFLKSGSIIPVYKVIGSNESSPFLSFIPVEGAEIQTVDSMIVNRSVISNNYATTIKPEIIYSIEDAYFKLNQNKSDVDYKIGWVQYNLGKFYKQERTSQIFYGLSLASSVAFAANPIKNTIFMYVAAGLGAAGFIIHLDAYKWVRRASIETTLNKVAINIKL